MPAVKRHIYLMTQKGQVRLAMFQSKEHVVVPVVALIEGVVKASNSDRWELVPASVLEEFPYQWNGRPVISMHPKGDDLSNNPTFLEANQFGTIFSSTTKDKKLKMEAWLDPARADIVGKDAQGVIRRARAGEPIEVSVGAMVMAETKSGEFGGKHYDGVWTEIRGDHLAMLPEGVRGACNNDMGCGAPRNAEAGVADDKDKKTLRERVMEFITSRTATAPEDMSDSDLRRALNAALRATEPGFMGVESVFPDKNEVIYATMPENEFLLFRRSYSLDKQGNVTMKEKKEQVEPVMSFEKVGASAGAPCECQNKGEEDMKTKKERVQALIANPRMKLQQTHAASLEAAPDEALDALEASAKVLDDADAAQKATEKAAADKAAADKAAADNKAADNAAAAVARAAAEGTKKVTLDEYVTSAPAELQDILRDSVRMAKESKVAVIKTLKDSGRCEYTDAELEAKSFSELQKLQKLCGVKEPTPAVDFSGRNLPRSAAEESASKNIVPKPPDMYAQIKSDATKH